MRAPASRAQAHRVVGFQSDDAELDVLVSLGQRADKLDAGHGSVSSCTKRIGTLKLLAASTGSAGTRKR